MGCCNYNSSRSVLLVGVPSDSLGRVSSIHSNGSFSDISLRSSNVAPSKDMVLTSKSTNALKWDLESSFAYRPLLSPHSKKNSSRNSDTNDLFFLNKSAV